MAVQLFEIIRGTDKRLQLTVKNSNAIFDLSSATTVVLYITSNRPGTPVLTKTLTVDSPTFGSTYYDFIPSDTESLDSVDYLGEVKVTMNSGKIYRTYQPFKFRVVERAQT